MDRIVIKLNSALLLVIVLALSSGIKAQILNSNIGFESGDYSPEWKISRGTHSTSINDVVSSPHPVRDGSYSMRLRASEDYRNELVSNESGVGKFNFGEEYWFGASVYLKDYDSSPFPQWLTIIQTHSVPGNEDWNGCCSGNSGWTLHADGDRLAIHSEILSDPYRVPSCASIGETAWDAPLSDYENQWVDVVINFRHSVGSDGFIRWWINGELVVDLRGPNIHYYDECGVRREQYTYLQIGIYKEIGRSDITREIYLDEIRIADDRASYSDVSPRGNPPVNNSPTLDPIGNQSVNEGSSLDIWLDASDPNGDDLQFYYSPDLSFAEFIDNTGNHGRIRLTPGFDDSGIYEFTIWVSDTYGESDTETITVTVNDTDPGGSAPVLSYIGDQTVTEGESLMIYLASSDPDGDHVQYSYSPDLSFATFLDDNGQTGRIELNPSLDDAGVHNFTITATDPQGESDSETIQITVIDYVDVNSSPVLSPIGNHTVNEGETLIIYLASSDPDGDHVQYSYSPDLSFATFLDDNGQTGRIELNPGYDDAGFYDFIITVTDPDNESDSEMITISVNDITQGNTAPVITRINDQVLNEGNSISIPLNATDADGDQLSFSVSPNLSFTDVLDNGDGTGTITFSPQEGDAGIYYLVAEVIDSNNGKDSDSFTLTVEEVQDGNTIPNLVPIGDQILMVGETARLNLIGTDSDGDQLTFSIEPDLNFISLTNNLDGTGILTIKPQIGDEGRYDMTLTVSDVNNGFTTSNFKLNVDNNSAVGNINIINSGFTGNSGLSIFHSDQYYNGGSSYTYNLESIQGSEYDELYKSVRYGNFSYNIPVQQEGLYTVRLHFAEVHYNNGALGKRIFNINIEDGQVMVENYDINADVGPMNPVIKSFTGIQVSDGLVKIEISAIIDVAILSGIEVIAETEQVTGIDDLSEDNGIIVYPNPSNGLFMIEQKSSDEQISRETNYYSIYDIAGKIVYESSLKNGRDQIDLTSKKKGIYILQIGNAKPEKIIIR